jgi:hypothetical protein
MQIRLHLHRCFVGFVHLMLLERNDQSTRFGVFQDSVDAY